MGANTATGAGTGAASGAVAGSAAGPWGTAIGGVIGAGVGAYGGYQQDQAAEAQQGMAEDQLKQQQQDRANALGAASSPQELQALSESIQSARADFQNRQKILDSANPALIEAGHQALALEQGQDAATLAPIRNQRAADRQQLVSQLQAQLGPGYATSSAGIQALNNFDQQTLNLLANQQNQTLQNFLGVSQAASANNSQAGNVQAYNSIGSQYGSIANRTINAIDGTPINNAGAGRLGALQSAKNNAAAAGALLQAGSTLAGAYGKSNSLSNTNYSQPTLGAQYDAKTSGYGLGGNYNLSSENSDGTSLGSSLYDKYGNLK